MSELKNRYDFALFFDVADGNPNGDPDAGNLPRVDAQTGNGLVTDVCLKRKVRNFIQLTCNDRPGYDIFIKEAAILNHAINTACDSEEVKQKKISPRDLMCKKFYDIRTFGAVMATGKNAGQVRGPVQMTFARSINQVFPQTYTITRMAITDEADIKNDAIRTMGRKHTIPYGLYMAHGFVSPQLAAQTGFNMDDLELFFKALTGMFEYDHSAARGMMASRRLIVFKHADALGNAPAWKLFDLIHAEQKDAKKAPRDFSDFEITVDKANCPANVEIQELI